MFKKTLIAALALAGASSVMANPTASEHVRLVIIWGDDFACGSQVAPDTAPTSPSLSGAGYFYGSSGLDEDPRAGWGPVSYAGGFSGNTGLAAPIAGGTDLSAGIAFMGKRLTGDKVLVLNLASPGSDIGVDGFLMGGRWPDLGVLLDGSPKALPANHEVRSEMASAIDALSTLLPAGSSIDIDGIVFSCWNNLTAEIYAEDMNFPVYPDNPTQGLGVLRGEYMKRANRSAMNMCGSVEKTFREEFAAAYGSGSQLTLSGVKPTVVGFRRPKTGRAYGGSLVLRMQFAQEIYSMNEKVAYNTDFDSDTFSAPLGEAFPIANSLEVVFIGASDGLLSVGQVHQDDFYHLSNEANKYIGLQMGLQIFN